MTKSSFGGIDDDSLQRILLSRSECDLGDIDHQFTNNSDFGEGKTTRQWIEENTNSSLYEYILLYLLGLTDDQLRDRILSSSPRTSIKEIKETKLMMMMIIVVFQRNIGMDW